MLKLRVLHLEGLSVKLLKIDHRSMNERNSFISRGFEAEGISVNTMQMTDHEEK